MSHAIAHAPIPSAITAPAGSHAPDAHDEPYAGAATQYLPDELLDARYHSPTGHGAEAALADQLIRIEELLGRGGRKD